MTSIASFPHIDNIESIERDGDEYTVVFSIQSTALNRYKVGSYRHGYQITPPIARTKTKLTPFKVDKDAALSLHKAAVNRGLRHQISNYSDTHKRIEYIK